MTRKRVAYLVLPLLIISSVVSDRPEIKEEDNESHIPTRATKTEDESGFKILPEATANAASSKTDKIKKLLKPITSKLKVPYNWVTSKLKDKGMFGNKKPIPRVEYTNEENKIVVKLMACNVLVEGTESQDTYNQAVSDLFAGMKTSANQHFLWYSMMTDQKGTKVLLEVFPDKAAVGTHGTTNKKILDPYREEETGARAIAHCGFGLTLDPIAGSDFHSFRKQSVSHWSFTATDVHLTHELTATDVNSLTDQLKHLEWTLFKTKGAPDVSYVLFFKTSEKKKFAKQLGNYSTNTDIDYKDLVPEQTLNPVD